MPVSVEMLRIVEADLKQFAGSEANFAAVVLARIMKAYPLLAAMSYQDYCSVHPYFTQELVCDRLLR
jgi:hypothetical protein